MLCPTLFPESKVGTRRRQSTFPSEETAHLPSPTNDRVINHPRRKQQLSTNPRGKLIRSRSPEGMRGPFERTRHLRMFLRVTLRLMPRREIHHKSYPAARLVPRPVMRLTTRHATFPTPRHTQRLGHRHAARLKLRRATHHGSHPITRRPFVLIKNQHHPLQFELLSATPRLRHHVAGPTHPQLYPHHLNTNQLHLYDHRQPRPQPLVLSMSPPSVQMNPPSPNSHEANPMTILRMNSTIPSSQPTFPSYRGWMSRRKKYSYKRGMTTCWQRN